MPQGNKGAVEIEYYSFLSSALDRVGGKSHAPAALSPGQRAGTHFREDCVGLGACLEGYVKSCPTGVRSLKIRDTDNAIPASAKHIQTNRSFSVSVVMLENFYQKNLFWGALFVCFFLLNW